MEIQKRNKDLTQIVDENWRANHNYDKVRELHQSENNNFVSLNNKEELYNFVESNYKRNE